MTLYQYLPEQIRQTVDELVEDIRTESWPSRFFVLFGLLCEKLETRSSRDRSPLLEQWAGIVTAVLEQLPPDSSVIECQALMSISFNDVWRAQALAQIDRDPTVLDRLMSAYPDWEDVIEGLADVGQKHPARRRKDG